MKPLSGKEMCRVLERAGWVLKRIQGSHHIYRRAGARRPLPVPVHGSQPLKRGTQGSIMRQAGLTDADQLFLQSDHLLAPFLARPALTPQVVFILPILVESLRAVSGARGRNRR